jgi:hypothetical protein
MKQALTPRNTINSEGKIAYSEGFQAWNTIRLKKELFSEFPELKEKRSKFSYELLYSRTFEELKRILKEMEKTGALPILMFLRKE